MSTHFDRWLDEVHNRSRKRWGQEPATKLTRLEIYMLQALPVAALEGRDGTPFDADAIARRAWYLAQELIETAPDS